MIHNFKHYTIIPISTPSSCSQRNNTLSTGSTAKISFELPYTDILASIGLLGRLNISPCQDNSSPCQDNISPHQDNRDQDSDTKQKGLAAESSGIDISGTSPSSVDSSPTAPSHSQAVEGLDPDMFDVESPAKRRRK